MEINEIVLHRMYKQFKLEQECFRQSGGPQSTKTSEDDIISNCWLEIERQCSRYSPVCTPAVDSSLDWKTVRLFVSSTFTDFFNEREILVKKVFPELREWCEQRKISLIDCDLRWGVPKDSTSQETISTCLEEIDRCQLENGQPFFLNLLGDRYGWIPSPDEVNEEVKEKYEWVANTSITFMEILCGAYRSLNPNAAFFIRSSDYLTNLSTDQYNRFVDRDDLKGKHLQKLKSELWKRFPEQVFHYNCHVVTEADTGETTVTLAGLEDFAQGVLKFFQKAIEKKYPNQENVTLLDVWDQERQLQFIFAKQKADLTIGREHEVAKLIAFATGENPDDLFVNNEEETNRERVATWEDFPDLHPNVSVISPPGFGKTSLMASLAMEAVKTGLDVFYHFVGSTGASCTASNLLQRLQRHVGDIPGNEDKESESNENVDVRLSKRIVQMLYNRKEALLVIVDGVNQLLYRDNSSHLVWLPPGFPCKVRCVVSTATEHPVSIDKLLASSCFRLNLGEISPITCRQIVTSTLARFNKRLDKEQLDLILNHPCAHQPLWLVIVCEELRVFGRFSELTGKISSLPATLDGLLEEIIERFIREDTTDCMEKCLCLIGIASRGLAVNDILNLLGDLPNKEPVALVYWAQVRRHLKPFIRTVSTGTVERVFFFHQAMEIAVRNKLIPTQEDRIKWSSHMADYLEYWCEKAETRRSELPDYLRQAGLKQRLVSFFRKSEDSLQIGDFIRSNYLQSCRCDNPATPNSPMTTPLMICMSCGMRSGHFSPRYHRNSESCVICGAWAPGRINKHLACICSWHSSVMHMSNFMPKCYICHNMTKYDRQASQGVLCQLCYTYRGGRTCALVDQCL